MRRKAWLGRVGLLLASVAASVGIAEAALRIIRPPAVQINHQPTIFAPDPEIGYRYLPNSSSYMERLEFKVPVRINNAGFFDDDFVPGRRPGVRRIAILGDSFTAGFHVGRGENFPDRLESRLRAGRPALRCEVMNFGMAGLGTTQQATLLERDVVRYRPDLVVLAFYENDVEDVQHGIVFNENYRGYKLIYSDPSQRERVAAQVDAFLDKVSPIGRWAVEHSYLVRSFYNSWNESNGDASRLSLTDNRARAADLFPRPLSREEAVSRIVEAISGMEEACRGIGAEFLFVVIPSKEEARGEKGLAADGIVEELERRETRTLSLLEAFRAREGRGDDLFWKRDGHCNAAGHALVASEVYRYLTEKLAGVLRQ
jgi:hypothetical protein